MGRRRVVYLSGRHEKNEKPVSGFPFNISHICPDQIIRPNALLRRQAGAAGEQGWDKLLHNTVPARYRLLCDKDYVVRAHLHFGRQKEVAGVTGIQVPSRDQIRIARLWRSTKHIDLARVGRSVFKAIAIVEGVRKRSFTSEGESKTSVLQNLTSHVDIIPINRIKLKLIAKVCALFLKRSASQRNLGIELVKRLNTGLLSKVCQGYLLLEVCLRFVELIFGIDINVVTINQACFLKLWLT